MPDPTDISQSLQQLTDTPLVSRPSALPKETRAILRDVRGATATLRLVTEVARRDGMTDELEASLSYVVANLARHAQALRELLSVAKT